MGEGIGRSLLPYGGDRSNRLGRRAWRGPGEQHELKVSQDVLQATAEGGTASFVIYLGDQADVSAAYTIEGPGRARLVRLQHADAARGRTQARVQAKLEAEGVAVQVVLGRQHDRRRGGRTSSRTSPPRRRRGDRVERRLGRPPGRGNARVDRRGQRGRGDRDRRQQRQGARALDARLHRPGHRRRQPGHRHALDARRAADALPRLGRRRHLRPQLQLARLDPRADHERRRRHAVRPVANSCGFNVVAPCDDQGHGTHTTGTVVGDDGRRTAPAQPGRRRAGREVDRLPQHGRRQRPGRRPTPSASSSSSRRPTSPARTPTRPSART